MVVLAHENEKRRLFFLTWIPNIVVVSELYSTHSHRTHRHTCTPLETTTYTHRVSFWRSPKPYRPHRRRARHNPIMAPHEYLEPIENKYGKNLEARHLSHPSRESNSGGWRSHWLSAKVNFTYSNTLFFICVFYNMKKKDLYFYLNWFPV